MTITGREGWPYTFLLPTSPRSTIHLNGAGNSHSITRIDTYEPCSHSIEDTERGGLRTQADQRRGEPGPETKTGVITVLTQPPKYPQTTRRLLRQFKMGQPHQCHHLPNFPLCSLESLLSSLCDESVVLPSLFGPKPIKRGGKERETEKKREQNENRRREDTRCATKFFF